MRKIVLVTYLYGEHIGGGAVTVVRDLARGLNEKEMEVVIITTHSKPTLLKEDDNGLVIYRFLPRNIYWVGNKNQQPLWKKLIWQLLDTWNYDTYRVVRKILDKEQPDIVHVHKLRGLSPAVWTAVKRSGINTLIHTCHDYELISPQGTLSGYTGKLVREKHSILTPYTNFRANLSKIVMAVTAPSQYTLKLHIEKGFFQSAEAVAIPNSHGLSINSLNQLRLKKKEMISNKDGSVHLLYLGRLEVDKGIQTLCVAFELVARNNPNIYLHIAGEGMEAEILKNQYNYHPQFTFHGYVYGEQKRILLTKCDVLIIPSQVPEVFGIVITEAYAYGLPVIASNIGGIPELVHEGQTGFLVEPGDIDSLSLAIKKVVEEIHYVRSLVGNCFEAAKRYTMEKYVINFSNLYQKVKNQRG